MNGGGVLRIGSEWPDVTRSDTDYGTNYIQITNTSPTQKNAFISRKFIEEFNYFVITFASNKSFRLGYHPSCDRAFMVSITNEGETPLSK